MLLYLELFHVVIVFRAAIVRNKLLIINTKNCSLSIVLTATDPKQQKSLKRW